LHLQFRSRKTRSHWPVDHTHLLNSTVNGTDYGINSGTSMAAPHVAGAAALFKVEHPDATPQEIMNMILTSSSKPDTKCDGGPQGYFTGDVDNLNEPLLFREPPLRIEPNVEQS